MKSELTLLVLFGGLITYLLMTGVFFYSVLAMDIFLLKLCAAYWLANIGIFVIILSFDYAPVKESEYNNMVTA